MDIKGQDEYLSNAIIYSRSAAACPLQGRGLFKSFPISPPKLSMSFAQEVHQQQSHNSPFLPSSFSVLRFSSLLSVETSPEEEEVVVSKGSTRKCGIYLSAVLEK